MLTLEFFTVEPESANKHLHALHRTIHRHKITHLQICMNWTIILARLPLKSWIYAVMAYILIKKKNLDKKPGTKMLHTIILVGHPVRKLLSWFKSAELH